MSGIGLGTLKGYKTVLYLLLSEVTNILKRTEMLGARAICVGLAWIGDFFE